MVGEAQVARDAYGSRFLLAVLFSSGGAAGEGGHWYAWDGDCCRLVTVAGAGFSPCPGGLAAWLPGPSARSGPLVGML
ncbi:MAG: hypothetical protein ACRDNF_10745, partial [Streptosporangiaceae bacterium]